MWSGTTRAIAFWGPFLGVSIGGILYLIECAQDISAPGTGFTLTVATPGGPLRLRAKNYSYEPVQGTAILQNLVAIDQKGRKLGQVERLSVTGLSVFGPPRPRISAADGRVWVRRDAQGNFDLNEYFQKTTKEPSEIPFELSLRRIQVTVVDESARGAPANELLISRGTIHGRGAQFRARLAANFDALGKGDLDISQNESALSVASKQWGLDLGRLRARASLGPEAKFLQVLAPLTFASGAAKGSFELYIPKQGPIRYHSALQITGTAVAWNLPRGGVDPRLDTLKFVGEINPDGVQGILSGTLLGATAEFRGRTSFRSGFELSGAFKANRLTQEAVRALGLTSPVKFQNAPVDTEGTLAMKGARVWAAGTLTTARIDALDATGQGIRLKFALDPAQIQGELIGGTINATPVRAAATYAFREQSWRAWANAPRLSKAAFGQLIPPQLRSATGELQLVAQGKGRRIRADLRAVGAASLRIGDRVFDLSQVTAAATYENGSWKLPQLVAKSPIGTLLATGDLSGRSGARVQFLGVDIRASSLIPEVFGTFDASGTLTGTLSRPQVSGILTATELGSSLAQGTLTAAVGDFRLAGDELVLSNLRAISGTSELDGQLTFNTKTLRANGAMSAKAVDLTRLLGQEIGGVVDLVDVRLAGTPSKPVVTGRVVGDSIVARNIQIDRAEGKVRIENGVVTLEGGAARVAGGTVKNLAGTYTLKTNRGTVSGEASALKLSELARFAVSSESESTPSGSSFLARDVDFAGTISGKFNVDVRDLVLSALEAEGRVDEVKINRAPFGSGDWKFAKRGSTWSVDLLVGSLESYLNLSDFEFDQSSQKLGGEIVSFNTPIQAFYAAVEPRLSFDQKLSKQLEQIDGRLSALVKLGGSLAHPEAQVSQLEVAKLTLADRLIGTLALKGQIADDTLTITEGSLLGPKPKFLPTPFGRVALPESSGILGATASFGGQLKEGRELDFAAEFKGFNSASLSGWIPSLEAVDIQVEKASLTAKGTLQDPRLTGLTELNVGLPKPASGTLTGLAANRLKVKAELDASGGKLMSDPYRVGLKGSFESLSIAGRFGASVPVTKSGELDTESPFFAQIQLDGNRDLSPFLKSLSGIETSQEGLQLSGSVEAANTLASPTITGGFDLTAGLIRYTPMIPAIGRSLDSSLRDVAARVKFEKVPRHGLVMTTTARATTQNASTDISMQPSGSTVVAARLPLESLLSSKPGTPLLDLPILDGSLAFDGLRVSQTFSDKTTSATTLLTKTPLKIAGTLSKPSLEGEVRFKDSQSAIPTLLPVEGSSGSLPVSPSFNLTLVTENPATIKSTALIASVQGSGSVKGTLESFEASGEVTIEEGSLSLPGARVAIKEGSSIQFNLRPGATETPSRSKVNIQGETSITALKNGITPERYDILITLEGDLLSGRELTRKAVSVPGDLSEPQIWQILGRADLLASVLQSGTGGSVQTDLRDAIAGYAIPGLLNPFTSSLAKGFGLEYVSVDYNAYEQASVSFVKYLARDIYLQVRRQISQPLPGQPVAYDVRVTLRPRRLTDIKNFTFSVGADQFRPYKISFDYTTRFTLRKAPFRSIELSVPK